MAGKKREREREREIERERESEREREWERERFTIITVSSISWGPTFYRSKFMALSDQARATVEGMGSGLLGAVKLRKVSFQTGSFSPSLSPNIESSSSKYSEGKTVFDYFFPSKSFQIFHFIIFSNWFIHSFRTRKFSSIFFKKTKSSRQKSLLFSSSSQGQFYKT